MSDLLAELRTRLYLDQDVRIQLGGMLRSNFVDAVTTLEAGRLGADDQDQLSFAASSDRAILTHNRLDFEDLHERWLAIHEPHAGILIAVQRRDLTITLGRILELLNRLDRDQIRNGIFYV